MLFETLVFFHLQSDAAMAADVSLDVIKDNRRLAACNSDTVNLIKGISCNQNGFLLTTLAAWLKGRQHLCRLLPHPPFFVWIHLKVLLFSSILHILPKRWVWGFMCAKSRLNLVQVFLLLYWVPFRDYLMKKVDFIYNSDSGNLLLLPSCLTVWHIWFSAGMSRMNTLNSSLIALRCFT